MKNEDKFKGNWQGIKTAIQQRWGGLSDNELVQADGITELASLISRKVGEPRPNVLHELIHLIQTQDNEHPLLKDYFENTSMSGGDEGREIRP